jgi:hypothetical protein
MKYLTCEIPEDCGYVIPIGDLHFADPSFKKESYDKLRGYIQWVKDNKNSRVVLGGDLFNVATRESKTSPFNQRMTCNDELNEICSLLEPIKEHIVGAIEGNHEARLIDFSSFTPTITLCAKLGIEYMGWSGVINFKVFKKRSISGGKWCQNYYIYFHHTSGGGSTIGGGLNRVEKLGNIIEGVDCYCGFHSHKLSASKSIIYRPNPDSRKVEERVVNHLTCGGYLQYEDSYAEKGMLRPLKLGSPRIRLDGKKKDLHISI